MRDFRHAARVLKNSPGFTAVALLVLALGIGANTAIFSVVNSLLLRPIPFKGADRIVVVWETHGATGVGRTGVSGPNFMDWREHSTVFEEMALFEPGTGTLTGVGEPEQFPGLRVTTNFAEMLGVKVQLGRGFRPGENVGGRKNVALLSHGYWQRRFGADPAIIGRKLTVDGLPYEAVGILAADFWFPVPCDAIVPWNEDELRQMNRLAHEFAVFARLRPGVGLQQAQVEMNALAANLARQHPELRGWGVTLVPLRQAGTEYLRPALLVLLGAVGFILLIACANLSSLMLARAAARQKEIAVRLAAGASRWQVMRLLLAESLLLGLLGGAAGLLVAAWGIDLLRAVLPGRVPIQEASGELLLSRVDIDPTVLAFTFAVAVLTGVLFGLAPAWRASRADLSEALKQSGRGMASARGFKLTRSALVAGEVALAAVLLIGAGLMLESVWKLQQVQPGFRPAGLLTMEMELPTDTKYRVRQQQAEFYRRVLEALGATPGVQAAGFAEVLPLDHEERRRSFLVEGHPPLPAGQELGADYNPASPGFFAALGIPLVRGRMFTDADRAGAPEVVIIDSTLVERYLRGEEPIGKRLLLPRPHEIVGVVGAIRKAGLDKQPQPTIYLPYLQDPDNRMVLVVRGRGDPMGYVRAAKNAVWTVDKDQPVYRIRTMDEVVADSSSVRRLMSLLLGAFAVVAAAVAALGVAGVVSYMVNQRTRELGLRQALGATAADLVKMIVREGLALALAGVALGVAAALGLTRALASLLYGVTATDPAAFAAVPALLLVVAAAASYLPARRAARVDPMRALRLE